MYIGIPMARLFLTNLNWIHCRMLRDFTEPMGYLSLKMTMKARDQGYFVPVYSYIKRKRDGSMVKIRNYQTWEYLLERSINWVFSRRHFMRQRWKLVHMLQTILAQYWIAVTDTYNQYKYNKWADMEYQPLSAQEMDKLEYQMSVRNRVNNAMYISTDVTVEREYAREWAWSHNFIQPTFTTEE